LKLGIHCDPTAYKLAASVGFEVVTLWDFNAQYFRAPFPFEPTPNAWVHPTAQLANITAAGLTPIGVLHLDATSPRFPNLATTLANPGPVRLPDGTSAPITGLNPWQWYVRVAVWSNVSVQMWRIWNEPSGTAWHLDLATYVEAVRQAAEVIHAYKGLVIAGCGDAFDAEWAFGAPALLAPYCDVLSMDYGHGSEIRYINRIKNLKQFGLPVWNVEYSPKVAANTAPTNEQWADALAMHEEAGVDFMSVYYMRCDQDGPGNMWDVTNKCFKPWASPIIQAVNRA
jgi:hypothetical protein